MAELLLVNPRKRRRKSRRRKSSGTTSRRRRRRGGMFGFGAPRRRRRRRRSVARLANPRRRRRTSLTRRFRRRRNPSLRGGLGSLKSGVVPTLKSGLVGASGALGLDLLWGYGARYLPAQVAGSPLAQYAAKLFGALLVGMIGGKVLKGRGRELAVGATTVVLHDALKAQLKASFPAIQLGEYLTYAPTVGSMPRAGRLLSTGINGMGEYLSGLSETAEDLTPYSDEYSGDGMNGY